PTSDGYDKSSGGTRIIGATDKYVISLHARRVAACYLVWSKGLAADERRERLPQDGGRMRGHCRPHVASPRSRTADADGRELAAPGGRCGRAKRCCPERRQARNSTAPVAAQPRRTPKKRPRHMCRGWR